MKDEKLISILKESGVSMDAPYCATVDCIKAVRMAYQEGLKANEILGPTAYNSGYNAAVYDFKKGQEKANKMLNSLKEPEF